MTTRTKVIQKLIDENKVKEFDTINLGNIGFYLNYGTSIIRHNESPTLTTKGNVAVVISE